LRVPHLSKLLRISPACGCSCSFPFYADPDAFLWQSQEACCTASQDHDASQENKKSSKEEKKGTNEDEKKDEVVVVAEPEVNEEDAIGAYWVTDGIDRCLVGFLPYHLLFRKHLYDGKLAQVVEFLRESDFEADKKKNLDKKGVCRAVLIKSVTST